MNQSLNFEFGLNSTESITNNGENGTSGISERVVKENDSIVLPINDASQETIQSARDDLLINKIQNLNKINGTIPQK